MKPKADQEATQEFVIGWKERVDLPDWGIRRLRAKVDTGAKTSAVHVSSVEELPDDRIRFEVVERERPSLKTVTVETEKVGEKVVKPRPGLHEIRPVVQTTVKIGPVTRTIMITLVCRRGMLCRMLLGRSALRQLLVDPAHSYLLTRPPRSRNSEAATKGGRL